MDTKSVADSRHHSPAEVLNARAERGLRLFEEHGHRIERIAGDLYRVPSQDGERSYDVRYGEVEDCPCGDHQYRGLTCCHLYALGISLAKRRRPTFERLYTEYLQAVRGEEARLGRQLTPSEAERINTRIMAPLNRAIW